MAADESAGSPTVYRCLVDRCLDLETSQAKLKQELSQLLEEDKNKNKKRTITHGGDDSGSSDNGDLITDITSYIGVPKSFPAHVCFPGYFLDGSPHRGVLESLGHALHVCTASSGQIFYWNRAAEILYGWKVDEVIGERIDGLLVSRKNHASFRRILGNLSYGRSWSGQFPLKKKTGEVFMALVTMTSMYEGNQLVGIVTVSSDAAVYNKTKLGNMNRVSDKEGPNGSKIQWQQRPAIASLRDSYPKSVVMRVLMPVLVPRLMNRLRRHSNILSRASMIHLTQEVVVLITEMRRMTPTEGTLLKF